MFQSPKSFFLKEFLETVTLSCIFLGFVGVFFHNMWPLIEILYLCLLNLSGGILQLDVEKFVGYLWGFLFVSLFVFCFLEHKYSFNIKNIQYLSREIKRK